MRTPKLRMNDDTLRSVRDARRGDPGPARLRRLIKILRKDIGQLVPADVETPEPVAESLAGFEAACSWAEAVAADIDGAEVAKAEAHVADVAAAATALAAGAAQPKTSAAKSDEKIAAALVRVEAVEQLVLEGHGRVVDTVHERWAAWDPQLGEDAETAHDVLREQAQEILGTHARADAAYSARSILAREMGARYAEIKAAMDNDKRGPFNFYAETHAGGRPLRRVALPDPKGARRAPIVFDLAVVLDAVAAAIAAEPNHPAAAWMPPTSTEYAEVLVEPLDITVPWVVAAVRRAQGDSACVVCGQSGADTVMEDGRELVLAHERCANREPTPREKRRQAREEKIAGYKRSGFPPSPDESMRALD